MRSLAEHAFNILARGLAGDRQALRAFASSFTADGTLWLPPIPHASGPIVGRAAIKDVLLEVVAPAYPDGLKLTLFHTLEGEGRVAFQVQEQARLRDGSSYLGSPIISFALRGDAISGCWKFAGGPRYFESAMNASAGRDGFDPVARAAAAGALTDLRQALARDSRALARFLAMLGDDVHVWLPPDARLPSPLVGRAAAGRLLSDVLLRLYPGGLAIRALRALSGGTRTAFELQSVGVDTGGAEHVVNLMLSMELCEGRLARAWVHWGGPGFFDAGIADDGTGAAVSPAVPRAAT
jgi:hypothetical protein